GPRRPACRRMGSAGHERGLSGAGRPDCLQRFARGVPWGIRPRRDRQSVARALRGRLARRTRRDGRRLLAHPEARGRGSGRTLHSSGTRPPNRCIVLAPPGRRRPLPNADQLTRGGSMAPLVSLVLAVKNGLPHLKATIDAVRRQTYTHYELVVQDGASTDGSRQFIAGLTDIGPVKLVSAEDGGVGQAYNRALARCSGDLVCFLACDEYLEDNALASAGDWFQHHPHAVVLKGGGRLVHRPNRRRPT